MSKPRRVPPTLDQAIGFTQRRWFQRLHALEDAIAYRRTRIAVPCPDCRAMGPGRKCADHARDLELIAEYRTAALRGLGITPWPLEAYSLTILMGTFLLPFRGPAGSNFIHISTAQDERLLRMT